MILSRYLEEFVAGMIEARKSLQQGKGKHIVDNSPEREAPQGPKKGIYVQMIADDPTLAGQSKRAIKSYGRLLPLVANISGKVNFIGQGVPQVPHHPPPIIFTEKILNVSRTPMMMP